MQSIQKQLHLGIYGLIERDDLILVVRKSRGPYIGLFDLPGGRPAHGEQLLEALAREIQEETGLTAGKYAFFANYSFLVPYQDVDGCQKELYHIALTYRVMEPDLENFNSSIMSEDVEGSLWVNRQQLRPEECSPLVNKIAQMNI